MVLNMAKRENIFKDLRACHVGSGKMQIGLITLCLLFVTAIFIFILQLDQ